MFTIKITCFMKVKFHFKYKFWYQRGLFLSEVNNRETMAAIEAYCLQKTNRKVPTENMFKINS